VKQAWSEEENFFQGPAHSLYLGGGTPSLLPVEIVGSLVEALPLHDSAEVTLEANPGTVDRDKLLRFHRAGVNRLSIGVQSLQPEVAQRLGRGHTVAQAATLLRDVADIGFDSWSLDLIFGVQGQTLDSLEADLDAVLTAAPPHISLYGLTIEPGTPFAELEANGRLRLPEEDAWRAQYDRIVDRLTEAGWERYEVSNFARPGHRSRHNEAVWRGGYYAGLGPGAHGFRPDGTRTTTTRDVDAWLLAPCAQPTATSPRESAVDHILSTLRHIDGTEHAALWEASRHRLCADTVQNLIQDGLLVSNSDQIRLTTAAFPLADGVARRLCATLPA
jgi:oxygen-independent coproporphyrinogen-3 oxidase